MKLEDGTPNHSADLVELVVRALLNSSSVDYYADARAILAALSSSGRLVPEGSEVREEWGNRYTWVDTGHTEDYSTRSRADAEFCERDHERRAAEDARWVGRAPLIRRLHIVTPWSPSVPDTEEGS